MNRHGIAKALVGALIGGVATYYLSGWLVILWARQTHPGSDPSLVFALVAVPISLIGAILGAVIGVRRGRRGP